MAKNDILKFQKIVSLSKRRGFVFPGSEIYGGLANTYDYGPLGVLMLRNITNSWWKNFVTRRRDMYGLDTSILMSPRVWEASGHTENFTNDMIDCLECRYRTRADHLIEDYYDEIGKSEQVEGHSLGELDAIIKDNKIKCPKCGKSNWTKPRKFNQLFETSVGIVTESSSTVYLRGEIAQGMFVNFKSVLDTMRPKLPFGIAQSGKAFRNEITLGNFIFRNLEFNLAEFEYFFDPKKTDYKDLFEYWRKEMFSWVTGLGVSETLLSWRPHTDEERAHYSTQTEDLDFQFSFGKKEMFGLAYRTDYDLRNHMEKSGIDLRYTDPETGEKILPHVMEPTFGINRVFLALLDAGYVEDGDRVILKLNKEVAPFRVAVFPLVRNKEDITKKAEEIYTTFLDAGISVSWDDRGNIGKRYYSQDEIGTPYCVTVDYQTLEDGTVTVRDRDTTKQDRVAIKELLSFVR
jgi:glycyl-tRNA synthetase